MSGPGALSVCYFGTSILRVGGAPCNLGISGVTRDLFHYLLIHTRREVRREYLADLFWGRSSPSRQRSAFNSAIWRIHRQIAAFPGIVLHSDGGIVRIEIAPHIAVDARELTESVQHAAAASPMAEHDAERLAGALDITEAPFLDGAVAEWALAERERFFNLRLRGLTMLMRWRGEEKRYEEALEVGRRLLQADPFREAAQCEIMWLYVLNGQRMQALRQYRDYAALLQAELDIEPMAETRALYDHILHDLDGGILRSAPLAAAPANPRPARTELDLMLGAIERSRRDLYQALRVQIR
jgi:DNA-binding SARP family transcriptional activator